MKFPIPKGFVDSMVLEGYSFVLNAGKGPDCWLARRSSHPSLFQVLEFSFSGKQLEAVCCRLGLSATKFTQSNRILSESCVWLDVASNVERGWSEFGSGSEKRSWYDSLAKAAPSALIGFEQQMCAKLGGRTAEYCDAAEASLELLTGSRSLSEELRQVSQFASQEQIGVARALAEWPGVLQRYGASEVYELACLMILLKHYQSELPNPKCPDEMPLENPSLMAHIQLTADRVFQHFEDA